MVRRMVNDAETPLLDRAKAPLAFLRLFYPFHYLASSAVEDSLRGPLLSRHECVVLWMIHSEAGERGSLPRKQIERMIGDWYELGSPAITKTLQRMAGGVRPLIAISDSSQSGRERVITLTLAGREEIALMIGRAEHFIGEIIAGWSDAQITASLQFLDAVITRVEEIEARRA